MKELNVFIMLILIKDEEKNMNYKEFEDIILACSETLQNDIIEAYENGDVECECFVEGFSKGVDCVSDILLEIFKENFMLI